MGNLKSLETLELSDNTIRSLPESIGRLKRLATLTLSNNGLTRLPESLGELSSVKLLDVSRNAIERVPGGLSGLGALTSLDMRENKLTEVPPLPRGDRLAQVYCNRRFGDSGRCALAWRGLDFAPLWLTRRMPICLLRAESQVLLVGCESND